MTQPRLLGGRYELDGVIGRGGMAEVYRARDIRLDRVVAVKTLREDLARDQTFQARFRREAQSAASLNHPSIVAVYDTGEDMTGSSHVPYIVMEYVDGQTLRELLRENRRLMPERCLEITEGVLRALDYSHRNGIIHRDIKPGNVMLTRNGQVKVMDFGIARAVSDSQATMTQTAQVIGTAQYLSPEQARGERVDSRSDLYSTGCLLYELLTGRPPFQGDSPVAIAYQHVRENPVPPSQMDPEVPSWADPIVLRAMAKDPNHRYQTAAEMGTDLQRALSGMPVSGPPPAGPPGYNPTQRMGAATAMAAAAPTGQIPGYEYGPPTDGGYRPPPRSKAWIWWVLGLLVVLGVVAATAYMILGVNNARGTSVPAVTDLKLAAAKQAIRKAGLRVGPVDPIASSTVTKGFVVRTIPGVGSPVTKGQLITIDVSNGSPKVSVPKVVGESFDQASSALTARQLKVQKATATSAQIQANPNAAPDTVIQESQAGQQVPPGTTITLTVVPGLAMPQLRRDPLQLAEQKLQQEGFTNVGPPEFITSHKFPSGTVIRTLPPAGTTVTLSRPITLVVAEQPSPSPSPSNSGAPTGSTGPSPTPSPTLSVKAAGTGSRFSH